MRFADAQRHVRRRNAFGIAEAQREGEVFVVDLQDHRRKTLARNERRGRFAPCQLPARHDAGITGRVDCERPVVTDRNDRAFHRAVLPESGFHPRAGQDFHEREAKASLLPVDGFATDGHLVARNERRTQSRGEAFDQARIAGVFDRRLLSRSANEGFARMAAASFAAQLDPTLDEIGDIKTAVSEAVTNAIVHAYPDELGKIVMKLRILEGGVLELTVRDWGRGIDDIGQARQPLFTTGGQERSGMGFTIMESFMDRLVVRSTPGRGTTVVMRKRLAPRMQGTK